jgi:CheY-like chemotaxis protein
MGMAAGEQMIVLVAEDDANDALLLKRAFQKSEIEMPVHVCIDGGDAMSYLRAEAPYTDREKFPFPRVLITDLKMPRCSGFELLQWLDEHPECGVIPIIVLSASAEDRDVKRCFELGANAYFQKPSSFNELCEIVKVNYDFWIRSVLPSLPVKC